MAFILQCVGLTYCYNTFKHRATWLWQAHTWCPLVSSDEISHWLQLIQINMPLKKVSYLSYIIGTPFQGRQAVFLGPDSCPGKVLVNHSHPKSFWWLVSCEPLQSPDQCISFSSCQGPPPNSFFKGWSTPLGWHVLILKNRTTSNLSVFLITVHG